MKEVQYVVKVDANTPDKMLIEKHVNGAKAVEYHMELVADQWVCDCPHATKSADHDCKHFEIVANALGSMNAKPIERYDADNLCHEITKDGRFEFKDAITVGADLKVKTLVFRMNADKSIRMIRGVRGGVVCQFDNRIPGGTISIYKMPKEVIDEKPKKTKGEEAPPV